MDVVHYTRDSYLVLGIEGVIVHTLSEDFVDDNVVNAWSYSSMNGR